MSNQDEIFMSRALELAALGSGQVSPNPLVGCVIVHDNKIIGEGWHRQYGQAHAEVNAVADVKQKYVNNYSLLLSKSTVYVTLEPCAHFGKTPPCADLLIEHRVKKVIFCNYDPNPLVAGKGIQKMKQAGIEVVVGVIATKGRELNRRFFTFIEKKRPYIILKWAQTADGFVGRVGERTQISNSLSQIYSHKWRTEEDAILVGTNTLLIDNPQLDARYWVGRNSVKLVIENHQRLHKNLRIFDNMTEVKQLNAGGGVGGLVAQMYESKIQSIIIEGGTKLLQSFIDANYFDEIRIFQSLYNLQAGVSAPVLYYENLKLFTTQNLMGDTLKTYRP